MCMSSLMTMQKGRGGYQLCSIGLATIIFEVSDLLGLGLVPTAQSPSFDLPDIPFLHLLTSMSLQD
jgi:hypothetical protein